MHRASFDGMAEGWKKGFFLGRRSEKVFGLISVSFMPKTSLLLVRTPKNVLLGVFRLTFVFDVLWSMCLPSFASSGTVLTCGACSFMRFMRTAKLSPAFRAFVKSVFSAVFIIVFS